jgi:hypothetical protein
MMKKLWSFTTGGEKPVGDYRDDDFREKPSCRDLDRRKDRSRHVGQGDLPTGQSSRWVRKQILREAERLFQGNRSKKVDPEQEKTRNEIHHSFGTKKFEPSVKKFLKEYGMPDDWGTLMLLLDCKEPSTGIDAIQGLKALYPQQGLEEQQGFRSKLNIISMTTKDDELRFCAEETLGEI